MKCPFCNKELSIQDIDVPVFVCENEDHSFKDINYGRYYLAKSYPNKKSIYIRIKPNDNERTTVIGTLDSVWGSAFHRMHDFNTLFSVEEAIKLLDKFAKLKAFL
jgi:hypothetical protein